MAHSGRIRHTSCKNCGADVEGYFYGYGYNLRPGKDWRDRGNNTSCAEATKGKHYPVITPEDRYKPEKVRTRSARPVRRVVTTVRPEYRLNRAQLALGALEGAAQLAREAGAPYLVERIRLAISSARGAVRNAGYRVTRKIRAGREQSAAQSERIERTPEDVARFSDDMQRIARGRDVHE